jgi:hypothetical protein
MICYVGSNDGPAIPGMVLIATDRVKWHECSGTERLVHKETFAGNYIRLWT